MPPYCSFFGRCEENPCKIRAKSAIVGSRIFQGYRLRLYSLTRFLKQKLYKIQKKKTCALGRWNLVKWGNGNVGAEPGTEF